MYQTLIEFLDFIGINGNYPQTIGDFIAWFVLVITVYADKIKKFD